MGNLQANPAEMQFGVWWDHYRKNVGGQEGKSQKCRDRILGRRGQFGG